MNGRWQVLRWTLATLASHWRRKPLQFAALFVGLALATALWSGVQGLNAQARQSYAEAAALLGGAQTVSVARPEGGTFDQGLYVDLRLQGWTVSPVLEGRVRVGERLWRVVGLDPVTLPASGALAGIGAAEGGDAGVLLGRPRAALVSPDTLAEFEALYEDAPVAATGEAVPPLRARDGVAPATLVMDVGAAQRLLDRPGALSRLIAPAGRAPDAAALAGTGLSVQADPAGEDLSRLTDSFHLNLTAFGLLAFVVGLFIAHAAIGLAFEQRLPTLRTLRACGVSASALAGALLAELVAFAMAAGVAGMIGGYVIAAALLPDVAASLRGLYGAPVGGALRLDPAWWLSGLGMSLLGALAAAGVSLWQAARLPVLAPAQPFAWFGAHRKRIRLQAWGGVALMALAAMVGRAGDGLLAGFFILGALLLGAALLLPGVLSAVLGWGAERAKGPLTRWLFADGRQALSGLSLALMALMLALAANIGVGTMVGGFREAFTGWLENRLAAEIYVRRLDAEERRVFEARVGDIADVTAILPARNVDLRLNGWPSELLGHVDHATYRDAWPVIEAAPEMWETYARGEGALVSEQLARRLKLRLGDALEVPTPQGPWRLEVVGVHPDYGNPKGQAVVLHDALVARFPEAEAGSYALRVTPGRTEAVLTALRADPALAEIEMVDQGMVKGFSLDIFDKTFAVTNALNALTLGVAGVALLTSLATLGAMRLPQLAPLWAMGLTRRKLATMELGRTLALAFLTALCAIPLGVGLAWVLVAVVNVQAFGWRLPFAVFPGQWAQLTLLALVTAAVASVPPILRLARIAPTQLLGAFANER
ncbi:MAG: FtsX-like permease family protein [Rubrimonas sp.]|uniref:ABC transporter permease n=1 Tax=Rubrimonas sp. TaxID=2036015 RepID=UPI002FDEF147